MAHFKLATKPAHAGISRMVRVGNVWHDVDYVPYGQTADVVYQKYTKDYRNLNSRPFVTKSASYKTLQAAVRSNATALEAPMAAWTC